MNIVCLDLEGVLVPEIWIEFAELTGIEALRATTRDIADHDERMTMRLAPLRERSPGLPDIQQELAKLQPSSAPAQTVQPLLPHYQVFILSVTFYESAQQLPRQLDWPT